MRLRQLSFLVAGLAVAGGLGFYFQNKRNATLPASNDDSLITSIAFRRTYTQAHPEADSIVVSKDWPNGQVTALALYAAGLDVFVHEPIGKDRLVQGLTPADLYRPFIVRLALQQNHIAEIPSRSNYFNGSVGQLERDFNALKTVDVSAALHPPADGKEGMIAYEWDDHHYTFTATDGCRRYDPPVNPLTGRPCLCLNRGDIFESVAFMVEYRRNHPDEKAVLVLPEIRHVPEAIFPAVAFTKGAAVFIHSAILGDVVLDGFKADDIANSKAVFSAYQHLVGAFIKTHGFKRLAEFTKAQPAWPKALPGDTGELQYQRALARMRQLGVISNIVWADSEKKIPAYMILDFDGLQYGWSYDHQLSYYSGIGDKPAVNSFVHGIIFASNFLKEHPGEKAFCYPCASYADSPPGSLVATTIYTLKGKVFSHHQQTGDLESPLAPAELNDSVKVIGVTRKIYQAACAGQRAGRRAVPPASRPVFDSSVLQPETIARQFKACGVPSRLAPTIVKTESGQEVRRGATLAFEWAGKAYLYTVEQGCFNPPATGRSTETIIAQK
jgi:hypothetical protein